MWHAPNGLAAMATGGSPRCCEMPAGSSTISASSGYSTGKPPESTNGAAGRALWLYDRRWHIRLSPRRDSSICSSPFQRLYYPIKDRQADNCERGRAKKYGDIRTRLGAFGRRALLCLLASRIGVPYPALLALAGAGLTFVPGVPKMRLDPSLALTLFVAPALMVAGFHASPRDLKHNWSSITGLVLAAVGTTIALVAWVAHAIVPGLPWAAAIALGAIVAPTDASAAVPILRHLSSAPSDHDHP